MNPSEAWEPAMHQLEEKQQGNAKHKVLEAKMSSTHVGTGNISFVGGIWMIWEMEGEENRG